MKKHLILTLSIGESYNKLADITHPLLRNYADRINADFMSIDTITMAKTSPHWEKFRIYDLLKTYDRIAYIDTDIIIRSDTPSLFDLVPETYLGMFNEAPYTDRSKELLIDTCRQYGVTLPDWDGRYFNSGVIVISRRHRPLFKKPDIEHFSFYEQTYLNMMIAKMKVRMFDLPYQYNRMTCMDNIIGEDRHASYIVHYAGAPNIDMVLSTALADLEVWKKWESGGVKFKQHVYVSVSGGLGDEFCAEPTIRYIKDHVFKDAEILVGTHHPRLFEHLDVKIHKHGETSGKNGNAWAILKTFPGPETPTYSMLSNLMCHTVDYCSISAIKRTLPIDDKKFCFLMKSEDSEEVNSIIGDGDLSNMVAIHPGKHWESKTMPVEWWQEIIDGISKQARVCLIGRDDISESQENHGDRVYYDGDGRGVLDVKCPENGIDLRNMIGLGGLFYVLSKCKVLLSNDSAPVHFAGAFDNWIVLIPTCKHPDHILPYRKGSTRYKTMSVYKNLVLDDVSSKPTEVNPVLVDKIPRPWSAYLSEPATVIESVVGLMEEKT